MLEYRFQRIQIKRKLDGKAEKKAKIKVERQAERKVEYLVKNIYFIYTLLFISLIPIVFYPFIKESKTLIWGVDGISQHYPALIHYGAILRDFICGKGFPMVDYTIGLGFDTITTLHYYILGDPIAILSLLVTKDNSIIMYTILIVLRMYLLGISFIVMCGYFKKKTMATLLATLIYVFSGYVFYAAVRHPYFINPMIYLPILIMCLEMVMRKEKATKLIIISFICSISNFYFLYYLIIMAVFYCIFRYLILYHKDYKNKIIGLFLIAYQVGRYVILGILMASIVLFPMVYAFSQSARLNLSGESTVSVLHYSKKYYLSLAQSFFATGITPGFWVRLSFPSIIIISLVLLITRKIYQHFKWAFILVMLGLCIPFFGKFMNGFSYVSNRWSFAIPLIVATIFVFTYEDLQQLNKKEMLLSILACFMYAMITFAYDSDQLVLYECIFIAFTVLIMLLLQIPYMKNKSWISSSIIILIIYVSLAYHGYAFYDLKFHGYVNEFLSEEEVLKDAYGGVVSSARSIEDEGFYRVETVGDSTLNEGMALGFHDVSAYFSIIDGRVTDYLKELEILSQRNANRFHELDNRTILNSLSSVKYMLTSDKRAIPYGYKLYKEIQESDKVNYIYENQNSLGIAYVYDQYVLREDYDKLPALEKQNAMLYAVIRENNTEHIEKSLEDFTVGITSLNAEFQADERIEFSEDKIIIKEANAKMKILFQGSGTSETYIRFSNLNVNRDIPYITTLLVKGEKGRSKGLNIRNQYHTSYFGKKDYLVNLGYKEEGMNYANIVFPKKDTFSYDTIQVMSLDMNLYQERINKLREESLSDIVIKNNKVSGNVVLEKDKTMIFTIPYSIGWKAYVNGQETRVDEANVMYMSIDLQEGYNEIELRYTTPYLKVGGLLTIISCTVFIVIFIKSKQSKKK